MGPRSGRIAPDAAGVSESTNSVSRGNSTVSARAATRIGSAARGSSMGPRSNPRTTNTRDQTEPPCADRSSGARVVSISSERGASPTMTGPACAPAPREAVRRQETRSPRVPRAGASSLRRRTWVSPRASSRSTTRRGAVPPIPPHPASEQTAPRRSAPQRRVRPAWDTAFSAGRRAARNAGPARARRESRT